jgi:DNA-binding response OmpR family regulator
MMSADARATPIHRLLVVEDDRVIASAIEKRMVSEGFAVVLAHDGLTAVELHEGGHFDAVILDLMLPRLDGLEVCRRIQARDLVPVLMLTARDDETDRIIGLSVGADDYLAKPFSPRELVARVRALIRRAERAERRAAGGHPGGLGNGQNGNGQNGNGPNGNGPMIAGPIQLDEQRRTLTLGGVLVHVTRTEFDLLAVLMRRPGHVLSREQLLTEVWDWSEFAAMDAVAHGTAARTVDSHIKALRKKIGAAAIRTAHGVGYAFVVDELP